MSNVFVENNIVLIFIIYLDVKDWKYNRKRRSIVLNLKSKYNYDFRI